MVELAGIVILGILAQWVAWRFKIPAILPLILIGLFVGPIWATYLSDDGQKWIEPIWNGQRGLFPGEGLYYFVSLAIAIILFEGGLTLKRSEIRNVGPVITKLITLGATITFFGGGIIAHYLFGLKWELAFLFSGLIIVTGPTVITPILRNIPLKRDLSAVLKWEGILIDPIGALVAVLVFEFISVGGGGGFTKTALSEFGKIVLFGTTFGFTFAHALAFVINRKLIPHYLLNVASLSVVLLVFVESEIFAHESGLLAVVVMGMVLANTKLENIKELLYFKESLSVLLISILFIVLAANINMEDLLLLYNWKTLVLFLVVVLIIRPLAVFASTRGSSLKRKEKIFISWVGPRGIVAAGIASLFGGKLIKQGVEGAEYITPLVFMVVLGTVLLNATTARAIAKLLGVYLKKSEGILIIGASELSRLIANYFADNGRHVVLIDSNQDNIKKAKDLGLEALSTDIYSDSIFDNIELNDMGYLMAMTGNTEINKYAIGKLGKIFGENGSFRLMAKDETIIDGEATDEGLFSSRHDFNALSGLLERFPQSLQETTIPNTTENQGFLEAVSSDKDIAPLFVKDATGELHIIDKPLGVLLEELGENCSLVHLGKTLPA